jgi:hypothetical protein
LTSTFVPQAASVLSPAAIPSPQTNITASPAPALSATGKASAGVYGLPNQLPSEQPILTLGGSVVTWQSAVNEPLLGRRNVRSQVEVWPFQERIENGVRSELFKQARST